MFEVNDIVLYNRTDVCRVQEIRQMACLGHYKDYYILKPVYDDSLANSTLFVPVDADENRICSAFTADELRALLACKHPSVPWLDSPLIRKKEYTELLGRSNPAELIGLIRTLSARRMELQNLGRKFSEADEKYLSAAEKKLYPLFKYSLGWEYEDFIQALAKA